MDCHQKRLLSGRKIKYMLRN